VKTVSQFVCLDGVGETCTYATLVALFSRHHRPSPLLRDSEIRKCVMNVRSSQCE